jgi:AP-1 complex subunit mu
MFRNLKQIKRTFLQVRYLKVIEKSGYQALPWVRYITTGGEYEIRMA